MQIGQDILIQREVFKMLTVNEIIKATNGKLIKLMSEHFEGISTDSRTIKKGEIFLALKGDNFDGHDFFISAMEIGGGAIINHDVLYAQKIVPIADFDYKGTLITVDDSLKALHQIGRYKRECFKGVVFAVIGSNGKTTTKEITASVLSQRFNTHKTTGNNNNHIGLPRSISYMSQETECLVVEMGTNRPGDIKQLCEIVSPDYAIITNIGFEHLEGFKSIEGVRDAELEILPFVKGIIANKDDKFLMEMIDASNNHRVFTYAIEDDNADVTAKNIRLTTQGSEFTVYFRGQRYIFRSKLQGFVNIYNCLAAITAGLFVDMSFEEIARGIENFEGMPMRYEIFEIQSRIIINDCYNANPSSMKEAIRELKRFSDNKKRTLAVLGDMLEMGDESVNKHKELGQFLNNQDIDILIATGEMMTFAFNEFHGEKFYFNNSQNTANFIINFTRPNDIILIKGSRGMKMERVT
ncbi:MAG: UDP-N-acetylmuramoyl-tripeptide--D-alanyl-D-alanine ligase, partial [Thermodesulfovibrionales bacterium]|nr:UDP-N-acetylmuramoyl-tripeptide--D-alanyl-D-alanine ligase [Thermodesulfovibrionales bacterium]